MVTERFAHILDDNWRMNAERVQKGFYTPFGSEEQKAPDQVEQLDDIGKQALLLKLLSKSPRDDEHNTKYR